MADRVRPATGRGRTLIFNGSSRNHEGDEYTKVVPVRSPAPSLQPLAALASRHRAVQEELPGGTDGAFPATLGKLSFENCGLVEDFHDSEFPAVIQRPACDTRMVD